MRPSLIRTVAVLGGGPSGTVLARSLAAQPGVDVHLFERRETLGGLLASRTAAGLAFDIGAFVFSPTHHFIRAFDGLDRLMTAASLDRTAVYPSGRAVAFPFAAVDFAAEYGVLALARAALGVAAARLRRRTPTSSGDFMRGYLGRTLYEASGLRHYVEILHQERDDAIGLEFAQQRLTDLYESQQQRRWSIAAAQRRWRRPAPQPVLVRPPQGFDAVHEHVGRSLRSAGVSVHLGATVSRVTPLGDGAAEVHGDAGSGRFDAIYSTIPVPLMLRLLGRTPAARYDQVALLSLFYVARLDRPGTVLYNLSRRGAWKRITVFSRWYGQPARGQDYWTVEITTRNTDASTLDRLQADFEEDAARLGLFASPEARCVGRALTDRAYPVFRREEGHRLAADRDSLAADGIVITGRQGRFAFISSHQAALEAQAAARGAPTAPTSAS